MFLATVGFAALAGCESKADTSSDAAASFIACESPQPLVVGGKDTGFDVCARGRMRRREAKDCPTILPRADGGPGTCGTGTRCVADGECASGPNGYCYAVPPTTHYCECRYGCIRDSDCAHGEICLCGDPVGRCVKANCSDPSTCGGGACADVEGDGCDRAFACQSTADECLSDLDCRTDAGSRKCSYDAKLGHRRCGAAGCDI